MIRKTEYRDTETNELLTEEDVRERARLSGFTGAISPDQINVKVVPVAE